MFVEFLLSMYNCFFYDLSPNKTKRERESFYLPANIFMLGLKLFSLHKIYFNSN